MNTARRLSAIGAGGLLSLAFAPVQWWGAAILAVTAFTLIIRTARSAKGAYVDAFLFGLGFFIPLLSWVRVPGDDAWFALSLYQAVIFAIQGPLVFALCRRRLWPITTATAWVAQEAIRSRYFFGGFPWGRLAFSQADAPTLHWAQWAGAPGVTLMAAAGGTLLAGAMVAGGRVLLSPPGDASSRRTAAQLCLPLTFAAGVVVLSGIAIPLDSTRGSAAVVAVVQGNVPRLGLNSFDQRAAVLRNHLLQTRRLAGLVRAGALAQPTLVIWPENSSDIDPFQDPAAGAAITAAARLVRAPILVGAVLDGRIDAHGNLVTVRNTGVVFNQDGTVGTPYVKRHPVPFGEYIPMRSVIGKLVGRLRLIPYDFEKGRHPGVLPMGPTTLADVICFEVAYDGIVRDAVTGGGRLLVVQTNNATFGRSSESRQQLAMGRLRAVEHNRTTLVAATSGISAIIWPSGRVVRESKIFTSDLLVSNIALRSSRTVADRVGAGPEWAVTALCGVLAGVAAVRPTHSRRSVT